MTVFCKKDVDTEKGLITFTFNDEKTPIVFDISKAEKVTVDLAMHGASQKIGDSYAGAAGDFDAARKTAQEVIDNLYKGDWSAARAIGEPRINLIVEALAKAAGQSVEAATLVVQNIMDADEKNGDTEGMKKLRADPAIKLARSEIQHARAKTAAAKSESTVADLF